MEEITLNQTLACIDPITIDKYDDYTEHLGMLCKEARLAQDHRDISQARLSLESFIPACQKALDQIANECAQGVKQCRFWVGRLWTLILQMLRPPRDANASTSSLQSGNTEKMKWRYVRNNTLNHLAKIIQFRRDMRDTCISIAVPGLISLWRALFADIAFAIEDSLNPFIRHYLSMPLPDMWTRYLPHPNKWASKQHYGFQGRLEDPLDERILVSLPETLDIWRKWKYRWAIAKANENERRVRSRTDET